MTQVGRIEAIFRYPVKSMAGQGVEVAELGWHGIAGDRRLGVRCIREWSGFPWLTATKLPDLLLFNPLRDRDGGEGEVLFLEMRRVTGATDTVQVVVSERPVRAGIDPFNKLIDRNPEDNLTRVDG